jgi:pilus assembly protein CpaF
MVLMSGMNLPVKAIRDQVASALDLIVQQSRMQDGSRKITHITEVQGMESDIIILQDIFVFKQHGLDSKGKVVGEYVFTGVRPKFIEKLQDHGIQVPFNIFNLE